ncbi:MAG: ATP-binding cassette domain-containing protein [Acetanaerobacterium sp.]
MSTILECEGVVKRFGKTVALNGITLSLEENKIYGLIGRNGAGKTTLLGILSGQNHSDDGSVVVNGAPVWENADAIENICFSRELSPSTSFGPDTRKVRHLLRIARIFYPGWDEEYAQSLINEFKLEVKKPLNKLSKGMLSMVSIVIALASRAPITFLDEPVAGLDVMMRELFYRLLLDDYMKYPRTFVISTHIIDEASGVFEEVVLVDAGSVMLKKNTEELRASYAYVSGREDTVLEAVSGMEIVHREGLAKSLTVCVKANDAKQRLTGYDVDVSPVSLQKIFVYLTERYDQDRSTRTGGVPA